MSSAFGSGAGRAQDEVGDVGVLHEQLDAGENEVVAPGARLKSDGLGRVLAGLFEEREAEQRLALCDGGDEATALVLGGRVEQRQAAQRDGGEVGAGVQTATHLVEDHRQVCQAAARAAVLPREGGVHQPGLDHLAPDFRRVAALVLLQLAGERRGKLALQQVPGQALEHLLRFGEG